MTGVIVVTGVLVVVETRLEATSYVVHVEVEIVEEAAAGFDDNRVTVDMIVFDCTQMEVKDGITVATDKDQLGTWVALAKGRVDTDGAIESVWIPCKSEIEMADSPGDNAVIGGVVTEKIVVCPNSVLGGPRASNTPEWG